MEGINVLTITTVFLFIFLMLPFLIYEIIKYCLPAMKEKEKKLLFSVLPISSILFLVGALFGFFVITGFGLLFFADLNTGIGIQNYWSLSGIITTIATTSFIFGAVFQLPILITAIVRFGFVTLEQLKKARLGVVLIGAIVSAVLTPPDVISQLIMLIPLVLLFEGTILYISLTKKKGKEESKC